MANNSDTDAKQSMIPIEAQIQALAQRKTYALLASYGIHDQDPGPFWRVTRQQILDYFRQHPEQAEAHLSEPSERPYHDILCLERRERRFVIFDMDHGRPTDEVFYDSLPEAAAEFVAYQIGYVYPSA
jgi:hypothetical protein